MAMQFLRDSAKTGYLKYILLGFLVLAGGGLVLTDVGGFFRGGLNQGDIGRVGGEKISISSFNRNLQTTLSRLGISPQQAYQSGYVDEILRGQMREIIMKKAAREQGIQVSREYIAHKINGMIEPLVQEDQDKSDILRQVLLAQGITEAQLVASVSSNTASQMLSSAITAGFAASLPGLEKDMTLYENEERSLKLLTVPFNSIELPDDPSEEEVARIYESSKERYALPETRALKILKLKNDDLKKTIEITDEQLKAAYEDNMAAYEVSETRKLQQAMFSSVEEAKKAIEQVKKGKTLEETSREISENAYLGEDEFTEDGIIDDIKGPAFGAAINDVVGPIETAFGWHVIVVKDIKEPYTKPFDDVSPALKEELLNVALTEQMFNLSAALEDLIAGGASLEEVQAEIPLEVTAIRNINSFGLDKNKKELLLGEELATNKGFILEEGFALLEGETSLVRETENGNFIAVHVNSITPKAYQPLDSIRSKLISRWIAEQRQATAQTKVEAYSTLAESDEKTLEQIRNDETGLVLTTLQGIKRNEEVPAPLVQGTIGYIFDAPLNDHIVLPVQNGFAVAQVISSEFAETADKEPETNDGLVNEFQNEALASYLEQKSDEYGTAVNRDLLERLYGPESQEY